MNRWTLVVSEFAAAVLVASSTTIAAGGPPATLQPETVLDWRSVSSPQPSPDGRRVVYVETWTDRFADTRYSNLWMVNADGTGRRALTTAGAYRDRGPRWSPEGRRLAYLSNRSGHTQIHVLDIERGTDRAITDVRGGPQTIAWSPSGQQIAFTMFVPAMPTAPLVNVPAAPKGAKWAAPITVIDRLIYRRDGEGYVRPGTRQVFVVPADGGPARRVTREDHDYSGVTWLRDGSHVVSASARPKNIEQARDDDPERLFVIAVSDGRETALTGCGEYASTPMPSPDGQWIAYVSTARNENSYNADRLAVIDLTGQQRRVLTPGHDADVMTPRWAADGRGLYFTSGDHGSVDIYYVGVDRAPVRRLVNAPRVVSELSIAASGLATALVSTADAPPDVVSFSLDRPSATTTLSTIAERLRSRVTLGEVEEIRFRSRDNLELQGWIVKPPDFDPAKKYPLLLYIHGGPHGMYDVDFSLEFQLYAARGYVVLYTNPRGSTGYGERFANLIQHDYPGENFHDLMAGVDAVLARGYVDEKKLAVTGGSGGGLLTAWVVGHTNRFVAAVAQYPSINWFSMVLTTDVPATIMRRFNKWPWEDPAEYMKKSPVTYAASITTPTMIITGEEDWRTPISQSEEFFRVLRLRGVDSWLVRVPHEGHGAGDTYPSHHLAKVLSVMTWLDRYVR